MSVSIEFLVVVSLKTTLTFADSLQGSLDSAHNALMAKICHSDLERIMHPDHKGERYRQIVEKSMCRFPYALFILRIHTKHTLPLATTMQSLGDISA